MPAPSGELIRDRLALAATATGAVAHRVIRQTDKTVLASATVDGRPADPQMGRFRSKLLARLDAAGAGGPALPEVGSMAVRVH